MYRWTLLSVFLLLCINLFAQNDSLRQLNVYRSQLFPLAGPALNADNGQHIVSVQYNQGVNVYSDEHDHTTLLGYGTQWRKHGFGVKFRQDINGAKSYSKTAYGIQYAYTFDLTRWQATQRTKLILGIGANYVKERTDFNKFRWGDQLDDVNGFIYPTAENTSKESIGYLSMDYQALIRSPKMYLSLMASGWPKPVNSFYPNTRKEEYEIPVLYQINSGFKIKDLGAFTPWLILDAKMQRQVSDYRAGITLSYKQTWMLNYQACNNNEWYHKIGLQYFTPRIRAYAGYQNTPNTYQGYFDMGTFYAGLALGITKQKTL